MKKFIIIIISFSFLVSCNSNKKPKRDDTPVSSIEKLKQEIDDIHIQGMSKMAALTKLQQQTRKIMDSISALPNKEPLVSMKNKLQQLNAELSTAEANMEAWMNDFYNNPDTLADNETERNKYLSAQKSAAEKVRDAIKNGIQKADSLLKAKF
jgi:chromosome segregation ATPase